MALTLVIRCCSCERPATLVSVGMGESRKRPWRVRVACPRHSLRGGRLDLEDWLGGEEGGVRDLRLLIPADFKKTVDGLIVQQAHLIDDADLVEPDEPRIGRRR